MSRRLAKACGPSSEVDLGDHLFEREIRRFKLKRAGLDVGDVENVVEQIEQGQPGALDRLGVLLLLWRQVGAEQQIGKAEHAVHGRAQFVAHQGQKIALGLFRCERPVTLQHQRALDVSAPTGSPA